MCFIAGIAALLGVRLRLAVWVGAGGGIEHAFAACAGTGGGLEVFETLGHALGIVSDVRNKWTVIGFVWVEMVEERVDYE